MKNIEIIEMIDDKLNTHFNRMSRELADYWKTALTCAKTQQSELSVLRAENELLKKFMNYVLNGATDTQFIVYKGDTYTVNHITLNSDTTKTDRASCDEIAVDAVLWKKKEET